MTLTEEEVRELLPILREHATWHGRRFAPWKMDTHDLLQQGFLGILTMAMDEFQDSQHRLRSRILAAKYKMIEGMRATHDSRPQHRKQIEWLLPDYDQYARERLRDEAFEDRVIAQLDRTRQTTRLAQLTERERAILEARLKGQTLTDIGKQLRVTKVRVGQIEKQIIEKLRETA